MRHCGKDVYLRPMSSDLKGLWNLSIGDGSSIPKGSTFYCTEAPLTIGKKVIFGPHPTIITGDHRSDVVGKFIMDSNEKLPENDAPVIIENDVWCGANVTILKLSLIHILMQKIKKTISSISSVCHVVGICQGLYAYLLLFVAKRVKSPTPVSYTHLDVYKRQLPDMVRFRPRHGRKKGKDRPAGNGQDLS